MAAASGAGGPGINQIRPTLRRAIGLAGGPGAMVGRVHDFWRRAGGCVFAEGDQDLGQSVGPIEESRYNSNRE